MTTLLLFAVASATPAQAETPAIDWDVGNQPMPLHTAGPLERQWAWSCEDVSDQHPLTLRCQVFDVTLGQIGTGLETVIMDYDYGTAFVDPAVVLFGYDVPVPQDGHAYAYVARCVDAVGWAATSARGFVYDPEPPIATVQTGPTDGTSPEATFETTCADDSYNMPFDMWDLTYQPSCQLYCSLVDDPTGTLLLGPEPCDDFEVFDPATLSTHTYADLTQPGVYRFEVYGDDGANNVGQTDSWVWEIYADLDDDGVRDTLDNCVNDPNPAQLDGDLDGVGDLCDPCPFDNPDDSDGDGVCDLDDACPGSDDAQDSDLDTVPDGCDLCSGDDATADGDGDGVCNDLDLCSGDDASGDSDGDGVCDDLDLCPADPLDDSDGDGSCDTDDLCVGFDDNTDSDGDAVPDGCDLCSGDDASGDSDGDGVCDSGDACPGFDDAIDTDGDGVCDGLDPCPLAPLDDSDGDGVCDDVDQCDGDDASGDADADGVCDDLDHCEGDDASGDGDGDGMCAQDIDGDELDCDDEDPEVHPAAPELCDGVDNNCDGESDEGCPAEADDTGAQPKDSSGCSCAVPGSAPIPALPYLFVMLALAYRRSA